MSTATQPNATFANDRNDAYDLLAIDPKAMIHEVTKNWGWVLAAGVISIAAGTAALIAPGVASGVAVMFIAVSLLFVGCFNLTSTFFVQQGMKLESFLTGIVQVLLAAVMAFYPFATLVSLTILLAAWMLVDGIFRIALAFKTREAPGWGWTLACGILGVAASLIVMTALPLASLWVIGILVGVNLIVTGMARIAIAMAARKVANATQ